MSTQALVIGASAVGPITALPNIRQFIAGKAGITLPVTPKGGKGLTMKEVTALVVATNVHTEENVKQWRKDLDVLRTQHYVDSSRVVGMLAADPTLRKSVKPTFNKKGECIGASASFRREKGLGASATIIAKLTAELAQAKAQLAALPA